MSYKRTRAQYEADLQKSQSPYVAYGTPLPPSDPDVRDDGSYVPVWKQEVRDERGRKRLHGAFTGGWSAGYFNTVGSKEGWAPSTFVSSRSSRRKDDKSATSQRPEDFMDEEDLADAQESEKLQTSHAFAGLGAADPDAARSGGLAGLFHVQGETMGTKLLKKMGWREGQGIGPKIRRKAELGMATTTKPGSEGTSETYLFAPENAPMIQLVRKTDRKGLGYDGESRLTPLVSSRSGQSAQSDDEDTDDQGFSLSRPRLLASKSNKNKEVKPRGGIGMGVLNDAGSDDEDPYEIGPRISYNRVIGGSKNLKKKKEANSTPANPALKSKPVFVPRRKAVVKAALDSVWKCHDGRPPLDGFVLAQESDPLISMINADGKYPPPDIPADWKSSKDPEDFRDASYYKSTADAAKASQLNPLSRAAVLGEKQLPGKSVFDFLSVSARDRLAAATGKTDLPAAKGEIPEGYALTEEEKRRNLWEQIPKLDKQSALGAMTRGAAGGGPYGDNEDKRSRYRGYLELQAGLRSEPPNKTAKITDDEWLQEFHEFYNVARIFRPMTGSMASRFTTSSSSILASGTDGKAGDAGLLSKPPSKPEDPAEAAAKMGMYGHMTRSIRDFYPTRLLCKRFGVKSPAHVQAEADVDATVSQRLARNTPRSEMIQDISVKAPTTAPNDQNAQPTVTWQREVVIDSSRNEALESNRAGEEDDGGISSILEEDFVHARPYIPQDEAAHMLGAGCWCSVEQKEEPSPLTTYDEDADIPRQQHKTESSTVSTSAKLSAPQEPSRGRSVSSGSSHSRRVVDEALPRPDDPTASDSQESLCGPGPAPSESPAPSSPSAAADSIVRSTNGPGARPQPPPPQYPASEASRPTATSLVSNRTAPPPFSSLFASFPPPDQHSPASVLETDDPSGSAVAPSDLYDPEPAQRDRSPAPAYQPPAASSSSEPPNTYQETLAETKRALPQDTKGESSSRPKDDDAEPPPAYSEGYSPLQSFTYLMAAAGGASSIITQVQQGGPPINTIGDVGADETITMDLRGTRFVLSRDELLTLPEFVLLSLFPNGLFPEGHMGGSTDGDAIQVDYDPESLQYMLEFFRKVASSIPAESSPPPSQDGDALPIEPLGGAGRDDSSKRAGIIVLREDLDFYVIPPKADIQQPEMIEVKRAAARALLKQDGIFSGLKRSDEPGTTEAHLIEMLTAGGFNHDDQWGHRAGEPNKAVVCSLALARLRSDIRGNEMGNNAVGMAQKLLLFWRKPARRCWWEGVELDNVEGVEGKLKVWIRRVWTLEMSVIGLR